MGDSKAWLTRGIAGHAGGAPFYGCSGFDEARSGFADIFDKCRHGIFACGPAGAEAHGAVRFVRLLPEAEGVARRELLERLVGHDGKLLIGEGVVEQRPAFFQKGTAQSHGKIVGLLCDAHVKVVLKKRQKLNAEQSAFGQHGSALLHEVTEILFERGGGDDHGFAEQRAHLGPAYAEDVAEFGIVGEREIIGLGHEAVAHACAVHEQGQGKFAAGKADFPEFGLRVQSAELRGR